MNVSNVTEAINASEDLLEADNESTELDGNRSDANLVCIGYLRSGRDDTDEDRQRFTMNATRTQELSSCKDGGERQPGAERRHPGHLQAVIYNSIFRLSSFRPSFSCTFPLNSHEGKANKAL